MINVKRSILAIALLSVSNFPALSMEDESGKPSPSKNSPTKPQIIIPDPFYPLMEPPQLIAPSVPRSGYIPPEPMGANNNFDDDQISQSQNVPINNNYSDKKEKFSEENKKFLPVREEPIIISGSKLDTTDTITEPEPMGVLPITPHVSVPPQETKDEDSEDESKEITEKLIKLDLDKKDESEKEYDSDYEYKQHQKASNYFFKKPSRKRELIRAARKQASAQANIELDGLSSRTRILLFRELTAFACVNNIAVLPFTFHQKEFKINLKPSLRQPGCGIIDSIGKFESINNTIRNFTPEYQETIAKKLIMARKKQSSPPYYHPNIPNPIIKLEGKKLDLEILNVLLDFEVARRLQKTVDRDQGKRVREHIEKSKEVNLKNAQSEYKSKPQKWTLDQVVSWMNSDRSFLDSIPVASAIVGTLKLSSKDPVCDLLLMSELPENKVPARGKMYLEKNGYDKLNYVVMKPNGKVVEKTFDININHVSGLFFPNRELTSEVLKQFKPEILQEASRRNHIENPDLLEIFFHAPDNDHHGYNAGDFNVFEGRPDGGRRKAAAKRIIKKLRGGDNAQNSSREDIHREYLDIFGGDSESDGEAYLISSDEEEN